MTLIQLETFLKIAEKNSFTYAANALGYAQSTVTTQIKQLEEELNCMLFERLGKSIVLTSEGERLLIYAQKMLQLEQEILLEVPPQSEPAGILRLGISESLCYSVFPQILSEYKHNFPKIEIQLKFIDHLSFPLLLKNGGLDMVYTLNPYIESNELTMLYKKPETLGFYVSPEYPLAQKENVTETDFENVPLLLTSHDCNFRAMLVEALLKLHITPNIVLETSSKEILKQFAMNQLGVAFMPDMAVEKERKNNSLIKLDWTGNAFPIFSQIFVHKDKHINTAMAELIKMIESS